MESRSVYEADEVRAVRLEAERVLDTISADDPDREALERAASSLSLARDRLVSGSPQETQRIVAETLDTMARTRALLDRLRAKGEPAR